MLITIKTTGALGSVWIRLLVSVGSVDDAFVDGVRLGVGALLFVWLPMTAMVAARAWLMGGFVRVGLVVEIGGAMCTFGAAAVSLIAVAGGTTFAPCCNHMDPSPNASCKCR